MTSEKIKGNKWHDEDTSHEFSSSKVERKARN
jgi:hypothetical protein